MTRMLRSMLLSFAAAALPIAAPASAQSPAPPATDPNPPSETMRAVLDAYGAFERARDRCDRAAMAEPVRRLEALALVVEEEEAEIEAELSTDGRPIAPGRSRRLDRARSEHGYTDAIVAQARRDPPRNCPEDEPPPSPLVPAPGRPGHGPAYYASLGLTYLNDGDLDLGLAQGSFEVDLGSPFDDGDEGLGNARLGPRFRLVGEVAIGVHDERNSQGGFRDRAGVRWSAVPYLLVELPVGDADVPGGAGFDASLFGRFGYGVARFEFDLEGPGVDISDSNTEGFFAFGAGADLFVDGRNGVRLAYTRWDDFEEDGISANLFSVSYVRRLGGGR